MYTQSWCNRCHRCWMSWRLYIAGWGTGQWRTGKKPLNGDVLQCSFQSMECMSWLTSFPYFHRGILRAADVGCSKNPEDNHRGPHVARLGTILKNIFKIRCNLYWLTIHTPPQCPCDPRITEVETPSEIRLHSIFYCVYIDACTSNWTPGAWTLNNFFHTHIFSLSL